MMVQTEIGLLPEDWEVKTIGECAFLKAGDIVDVDTTSRKIYPCFGGNGIRGFVSKYTHEGTFPIIGRQGEWCGNVNLASGRFYATEHAVVARPNKTTDAVCLYYFLKDANLNQYATGCAQPGLSVQNINKILIPLPKDKTEQQNIASALSSIDKLIDDLGRTIQKKQCIREGAMEELLSGKKRLPGFTEEWVEVKFEEIYRFAKEGGTPSTSVAEFYKDANIPFAKIEDLSEHYLTKTSSYISELGLQNSSAWLVPVNSLLLSNGATLGEVTITAIPTATKQGILGLVIREQFSLEYLYYVFKAKTFQRAMEAITTHGTMDCAYLKDLKGIPLYIPSDILEQHAIADILTSMDDEISLLESERAKYEQIRSGMMEELLTGKKRLIKN